MNSWNIPDLLEREVRSRDKNCVYCGIGMPQRVPRGSPRNAVATWEHIINDARITTRDNIAMCCCACNASKGQKTLIDWLQSAYCAKRGITEHTVAQIVKDALAVARKTPNHAIGANGGPLCVHISDDFNTSNPSDASSRPPSLILFSLGA